MSEFPHPFRQRTLGGLNIPTVANTNGAIKNAAFAFADVRPLTTDRLFGIHARHLSQSLKNSISEAEDNMDRAHDSSGEVVVVDWTGR